MAIIEFANDEKLNNKPVLDFLNELASKAETGDPDALWILPRIRRALDFVAKNGIPDTIGLSMFGVVDDAPFTLTEVVKQLEDHPPLLELRVNKKDKSGAYRAIFFPYESNGQQYLVFTRSVVKPATYSPEFESAIVETEAMYPDFIANPSKYINL